MLQAPPVSSLQLLDQTFLSSAQRLSPFKLSHVPSPTRRHLSPLSRQGPILCTFPSVSSKLAHLKLLFRGLPWWYRGYEAAFQCRGQGTRLHTLQLRVPMLQLKIPQAASKTWGHICYSCSVHREISSHSLPHLSFPPATNRKRASSGIMT